MSFNTHFCSFYLSNLHVVLSILFTNALNVCFLRLRDKVSYPYEVAYTGVSIVIFNCAPLLENQFASMILDRVLSEIFSGLLLNSMLDNTLRFVLCVVQIS